MKFIRRNEDLRPVTHTRPAATRDLYFFYERNTGVAHFHVQAGPDGRFPADQAAGLLAMHCMVRGQSPSDYIVMVQADEGSLEGLTEKAEKLLHAGRSVKGPVILTRREEEVLGGLMRSLANKEIASELNLSERTVKFHVSALLAKFRVRGRMELVREATRAAVPRMAIGGPAPFATREAQGYSPRELAARAAAVVPLKARMMA